VNQQFSGKKELKRWNIIENALTVVTENREKEFGYV